MRFSASNLAVIALLAASPALSQQEASAQWSEMSDADLGRNVSDFYQYPGQAPCERGVPATAELARRYSDNAAYAWTHLIAETYCAMKESRWDDAWTSYSESENYELEYNPFLGLHIAVEREDAEQTVQRFRYLVEDTQLTFEEPYQEYILGRAIRLLMTEGHEAAFAEIAHRAFREGRFETLSSGFRGGFSSAILREQSDLSEEQVHALLDELHNPVSVLGMLVSRDFEAIWPILEERAGPNLSRVGADYTAKMKSEFAENADNTDTLSELAYALYYDGRFPEIIALYRSQREGAYAGRPMDEPMAWVANLTAYSLDVLGRRDEADAIFDELAEYDEHQAGWLVNFVINRAARLVGQRRFEEGLEASLRAREVADPMGSDFARMLVALARLCALSELGREDETGPELQILRDAADDHPLYVSGGLMCAGLEEEARELVVTTVSDPDKLGSYLVELHPGDIDLLGATADLPNPEQYLWADPELVALYEEHARQLPAHLIPRAALIRQDAGS